MTNKRSITVLVVFMLLSLSALLPVQAIVPPSSGQKLWYKFDENIGLAANDSSGNGNTGILKNTTWVLGKNGYALSFNSTRHSYVRAVNSPSLNITGNTISVCAWLNTTYSGASFEAIIEKGNWESGEYGLYISGDPGIGFIRWQIHDVGILDSVSTVNNGLWHLLCGTYDASLGSNQMKLYLDNSLNAQTNAAGTIGFNSNNLTTGTRQNLAYWLDGKVDEPMIYNRALSWSEVQQIYSYGFQVTTTVTNTSTVTSVSTSTSVRTTTRSTTVTATATTTSPQPFTIQTNSTLLSYSVSGNGLNVTVSGPSGTIGHTKVTLLKTFFTGNPIIYLDNGYASLIPPTMITSNSTHWTLDLYYHQSQHQLSIIGTTVVPEFPSGFILLLLTLTIPLTVLRRKNHKSLLTAE